MNDTALPKIIWFCWLQGLEAAPLVVKKCYRSWLAHNPGWQINFLDENNMAEYVSLLAKNATKQALSDVLRINLLARYGGVWVDATCFCLKPLDEWLPGHLTTGFFAFDKPVPGRMIGSWFLAGSKYNYIINTLQIKINAYWNENPGMKFIEGSKWRFLSKRLEKMDRRVWFGGMVPKLLKVYPYFWFHYLFADIYQYDENFRQMWDDTPTISADIPHTVFFAGLLNPLTDEVKAHIDNKTAPLYKLTWKYGPPETQEGSVVDYLLKRSD